MMAAKKKQNAVLTLKELLNGLSVAEYLPEIEVKGLALDSRKVEPGFIFVALEGQFDHGLAYAEAAIARGAVAVLCDSKFDQYCQQILSKLMTRVICIPVNGLQNKLGEFVNKFYAEPSRELYVTGVTGTDGKTSVSHFIAQAMNHDGDLSAVIGTLGNGLISNMEESTHTTPDVISLHEMMAEYLQAGITSVAMEVSSHGLDQQRVSGIDFDVAVLTNLTRDHLDYHGDLNAYKQAKKKLFVETRSHSLVLNADDEFGLELYSELKAEKKIWLYGFNESLVKQSDLYAYASNVEYSNDGMSFMLNTSHGTAEVKVQLFGKFNISNVLACVCVLLQRGVNFNHVIKRIEKIHTVAGRMQLISQTGKATVVVDYAHTPEALSQALKSMKSHARGKIICVFGCGGDRDSGKRPLMAQAAEKLSDLVILTNDNPRNESPENIIDDIKQGISNELQLIVEMDRRKAIKQAVKLAGEKDIVLIAGKGHEQYQIIANEKIPFSDVEVAIECLEASK